MNTKPAKSAFPRRKFLSWFGIVSAVVASGSAFAIGSKGKKKQGKMVKMLTQDGKLVEVDESMIQNKKTRITDEQLQNWIKRK